MSTPVYITLTLGCLAGVVAFGLLMAELDTERREREMVRHVRRWRHGRIEE